METKVIQELAHRDQLGELLNRQGLTFAGAEIGVEFGHYADTLLAAWKGSLYVGVDPYVYDQTGYYVDGVNQKYLPELGAQVRARLASDRRYVGVVYPSPQAAALFADGIFDWIYIDGNHRYEAVQADLAAWWPKVHAGGIVGGHDWYERNDNAQLCGVIRAVTEFVEPLGVPVHLTPCTSWWTVKP